MKILFIDQEVLFAEALECLLEDSFGLCVAAQYVNSISVAMDFYLKNNIPDLIFLDVNLFENNGNHLVERLHKMSVIAPVIVISEIESVFFGHLTIKAGASGFISKKSNSSVLLDAVDTVMNGGIYSIYHEQESEKNSLIDKLNITERQYEILNLLSKGLLNKQIASELCISSHTVNAHLHELFAKLHVTNRTSAVQSAYRIGLI